MSLEDILLFGREERNWKDARYTQSLKNSKKQMNNFLRLKHKKYIIKPYYFGHKNAFLYSFQKIK